MSIAAFLLPSHGEGGQTRAGTLHTVLHTTNHRVDGPLAKTYPGSTRDSQPADKSVMHSSACRALDTDNDSILYILAERRESMIEPSLATDTNAALIQGANNQRMECGGEKIRTHQHSQHRRKNLENPRSKLKALFLAQAAPSTGLARAVVSAKAPRE